MKKKLFLIILLGLIFPVKPSWRSDFWYYLRNECPAVNFFKKPNNTVASFAIAAGLASTVGIALMTINKKTNKPSASDATKQDSLLQKIKRYLFFIGEVQFAGLNLYKALHKDRLINLLLVIYEFDTIRSSIQERL